VLPGVRPWSESQPRGLRWARTPRETPSDNNMFSELDQVACPDLSRHPDVRKLERFPSDAQEVPDERHPITPLEEIWDGGRQG
jgi:hypothetical protein